MFEYIVSFKLGGGYSIMFGGMLIHLCHALEYMHFHVFSYILKISKRFWFIFKVILAKCVLFVLISDILFWDLNPLMLFFLSGKCMHGLRVSLVDSRILYAKVASLRTFRGP